VVVITLKQNDMNVELEKLLKIALTDGVLTVKERGILLRKAESLGIDTDEFEMYIENKLSELQNENQTVVNEKTVENKKDAHNPVIKCPQCNDVIPPLSKICPSCNYAINATTSENKDSLEVLIKKVEDCIVLIKTYHKASFGNTLKRQIGLLILLIGVILLTFTILKLRTVDWGILFFILSIITTIAGIITLVAYRPGKININEDEDSENADYSYNGINAEIEKYLRVLRSLYGQEQKVKVWLTEFSHEISIIKTAHKKKTIHFLVIYGIMLAISILLFMIPAAKSDYEISAEIKNSESSLVYKAEQLINAKKIDEVEQILSQLKSDENRIIIKSKIQLQRLTEEINALEPLIDKKEYSKLKLNLEKIVWEKISTDYSTEDVERDIYETFLKKKEAVNNQLPEKYQIEMESKYSL